MPAVSVRLTVRIDKSDLYATSRVNLERLARYLKLDIEDSWSHKHIARLVYWRLKRTPIHR